MTATEGASPTLRILHLEDSGPDAELIRAELTAHWPDCRIEVVSTRADFLGAIDREDFDLILSDYSIPGFDGMAALDEARRRHPVTPFIFVSGTIGEDNAVEALKRGATDYVIKDRMDRLVPVLRRALVELRETRLREEAEKRLESRRRSSTRPGMRSTSGTPRTGSSSGTPRPSGSSGTVSPRSGNGRCPRRCTSFGEGSATWRPTGS